jgi:hypothetical protein
MWTLLAGISSDTQEIASIFSGRYREPSHSVVMCRYVLVGFQGLVSAAHG